jgi:hypothetical protein
MYYFGPKNSLILLQICTLMKLPILFNILSSTKIYMYNKLEFLIKRSRNWFSISF